MAEKNMIIEKKLGIPPDYQYRAITKGIWLQKNWHRNKFEVIHNQMRVGRSKIALDLGTGSGNFEILFSSLFEKIVGVDYNDEALNFLSSQLKCRSIGNVDLVRADIRKLPKKVIEIKYDLIVIIDAIEHVSLNDATKTIRNLKSLLSNNGQLMIITPNYKSSWLILEYLLDKFSIVPKFVGEQHLAKFDSNNLSGILDEAGYENIKSCSFNLFSYLFPSQRICNWLLKLEAKYIGSNGCLVCVSANKSR